MGYREVLLALAEETERRIAELDAEARRASEAVREEARRDIAAERDRMIAEARRRFESDEARARSRLRLEGERARLVEERRLLADFRREADARLRALDDDALLTRLADELVCEIGEGAVELYVDAGAVEGVRRHLERAHPQLAARSTITTFAEPRGGVAVLVGEAEYLDNTLASRLARAWPRLEGEIAAMLFGESDGGL